MQKYDVAIIGGGLIGCASAYYLAKAGARVVVIERGQLNQGASGQNAGSLHFQLEYRLIEHRQQYARELEHYVALTQLAIGHWRDIEAELGCDLEVVMDGGFMVAETADEIAVLEEKSVLEKGQGLKVELLDRAAIQKLAPYLGDTVGAALFCPDEGHCNPRLLTPAYARRARENRVEILTNTRVTGIRASAGTWQVEIAAQGAGQAQVLHADKLLNSAGAWATETGRLAGIDLPLLPIGLVMNVTEKVPPTLHHLIQHAGRKLSMKQVDDGNILIGGGWLAEIVQKNGTWLSTEPARANMDTIQKNLRVATEIVPLVRDLHLLRTWTGITALAPDQLPLLGEVPQAAGFYVAAGGSGFTYGPTYARLVSELMLTGATSFPLAPYAPGRFA